MMGRITSNFICNKDPAAQVSQSIDKKLKQWNEKEKGIVTVVLLGTGESGKSTITKQMKIIHINGFTDSERRQKVTDIRKNVRDAALTISGALSLLNMSLENEQLRESIDYLMEYATQPDFTYPQEFYNHVSKLWSDPGYQKCYKRNNEYQLIDCAKYFLDRLEIIRGADYIPSDKDILRCRVMTNTITKIDYKVKDGKTEVPFSVYDVGGQRGEQQKWVQVFNTATAILFLVDCSSFDQVLREDHSQNRLLEAAKIFDQVWNHRWLRDVNIILFINKIDVLEEKVSEGKSLNTLVDEMDPENRYYELFRAFKTFQPKDSERREFLDTFPKPEPTQIHSTSLEVKLSKRRSRSITPRVDVCEETIRTAIFIKNLFMAIVEQPKRESYGRDWHSSHNCEYFYTCAIDTDNIKKVLDGCRSLIIKKHLAPYL